MHIKTVRRLVGNKALICSGNSDTTISLEIPIDKLMRRDGQDLANLVFGPRGWALIKDDDDYKALEYEYEARVASLEDF